MPRVMTIAAVGGLGILFVASHARVASLEREHKALRQTLEARHAENAFLQVALDGLSAPEKLAREAGRMGLQAPGREIEIVALPSVGDSTVAEISEPERVVASAKPGSHDTMTATALRVEAYAQMLKGAPVHASHLDR